MDISESLRIDSEDTPLIPAQALKKPKTPLPKLQIGILMLLELAEAIALVSIYPYINQLVRELPISGGDAAVVGYYVGVIESISYLAQALTLYSWNRLSDRIGRKPVLLIGLSGTYFSVLCFGLSTTFWGLVVSRFMWGALDANVGVMKTVMGELTDSSNIAQGFAFIPIVWSIGSFVGSLTGGTLARPQDHWPRLFADPFWGKHPYFLPSAFTACVLFLSFFIFLFFLEETLSSKRRPKLTSTTLGNINSEDREASAQSSMANIPFRSLLTPTIMIPIANYCMLALLETSFRALLSLFLSTSTHLGGLGLTPSFIGSWLAFCGMVDGLVQVLFFAKIINWLGPKRLFRMSASCFAPIIVMFPILSCLARARGLVDYTVVLMLFGQLILMLAWNMTMATAFIFITASAPTKNVLGSVNGLAQASASICRVIGPTLATSLFALSKKHNLLDGNAVYVILVFLSGVLVWLTSKLPEQIQDKDE